MNSVTFQYSTRIVLWIICHNHVYTANNVSTTSSKNREVPAQSQAIAGQWTMEQTQDLDISSMKTIIVSQHDDKTKVMSTSLHVTEATDQEYITRLLESFSKLCNYGFEPLECFRGKVEHYCFGCNTCNCDELCHHYGDCCANTQIKNPIRGNIHTECIRPQHQMPSKINASYDYFMITSCPNSTEDSLCSNHKKSRTFNITNEQPVTSSVTSNTYRNVYCAYCHGEPQENLFFWMPQLACSTYDPKDLMSQKAIRRSVEEKRCNFIFTPNKRTPVRECHHADVISTCNVTGLWKTHDPFMEWACGKFRNVFIRQYRNVFCFLCNGHELIPDHCGSSDGFLPIPFTAVLNFRQDVVEASTNFTSENNMNRTCKENEIFDAYKEACQQLSCKGGKRLVNTECRSVLSNVSGIIYQFSVSNIPQNEITSKLWPYKYKLQGWIWEYVAKNLPELKINTMLILAEMENIFKLKMVWIYMKLTLSEYVQIDLFEQRLVNTLLNPWIFSDNNDTIVFEVTLDNAIHIFSLKVYQNLYFGQEVFITNNKIYVTIYSHFYLDERIYYSTYQNISWLLVCPRIKLNTTETKAVDLGNSILLPELNIRFYKMECEFISPDIVVVCADKYINGSLRAAEKSRHKSLQTNTRAVLPIVSFVCSILALTFLTVTLAAYCCFPELRSLPGKNNMGLVLSDLVAQALFAFGINWPSLGWGCTLLGVLIHFALLASVFWRNICSFHMYRVFSSFSLFHHQTSQWKTLTAYNCYIYGISTAIVSLSIVVNYFTSGGVSIGYGGKLCYLNTALDIGLYFALPCGLVIVANFTFFFLTIHNFHTEPKIEGQKSRERVNVYIYIKLSTITGFYWLFGYVAELTDWLILEYVFVLLNGFQAVFIFMSFVGNRRVFKLCQKFCSEKHSQQHETRITSID